MPSTINASNSGSGGLISAGDASGVLALQTAGTTAITVDTSQNVGIGTASPSTYSAKLAIVASSGVANQWLVGGASSGAYAYFSNNAQSSTANTMQIGQGWASGSDNIGFLNTNGANPMLFATNGAERMRINSSGQVFINNTSLTGSPDNLQLYPATTGAFQYGMMIGGNGSTYTVYAMRFLNTYTPAVVGSIVINNTTTSFNTSSDYRLKENIAPMTDALAKVALLKPVTYKWKSDGSNGEGFIAHELAEVVPQAVTGAKDAFEEDGTPHYQGIDTSFLVATLTAAIQELKAINDTQAEELSRQAATINAQSAALAALTARVVALEGK